MIGLAFTPYAHAQPICENRYCIIEEPGFPVKTIELTSRSGVGEKGPAEELFRSIFHADGPGCEMSGPDGFECNGVAVTMGFAGASQYVSMRIDVRHDTGTLTSTAAQHRIHLTGVVATELYQRLVFAGRPEQPDPNHPSRYTVAGNNILCESVAMGANVNCACDIVLARQNTIKSGMGFLAEEIDLNRQWHLQ